MIGAVASQGHLEISPFIANRILEILQEKTPKIIEKISVDIHPAVLDARILQNKKQIDVIRNNALSAVTCGCFIAAMGGFTASTAMSSMKAYLDGREMIWLTSLMGIGSLPIFALEWVALPKLFGIARDSINLLRGEYAKNSKDLEKCRSLLKDAAFRNFARQFGEEHSPARLIQLGELYAAPNK